MEDLEIERNDDLKEEYNYVQSRERALNKEIEINKIAKKTLEEKNRDFQDELKELEAKLKRIRDYSDESGTYMTYVGPGADPSKVVMKDEKGDRKKKNKESLDQINKFLLQIQKKLHATNAELYKSRLDEYREVQIKMKVIYISVRLLVLNNPNTKKKFKLNEYTQTYKYIN